MKILSLLPILLFLSLQFTYAQLSPQQQRQFASNPLTLVENKGQITDQFGRSRNDIQFKTGGAGVSVFIGNGQLHYQFSKTMNKVSSNDTRSFNSKLQPADTAQTMYSMYRLDMSLEDANTHAVAVTEDKQAYYENYHTTALSTSTPVSAYARVIYKDIYPYIDWVLYIKNNKLEYDFIIRPGGNAADIKIKYSGATDIAHTDGNIKVATPLGDVTEQQLYVYEQNTRKSIPAAFYCNGTTIGFHIQGRKALSTATYVIDPTLVWGTYFGGTNIDQAASITCSSANDIYITGYTDSHSDIATVGAYQTTYGHGNDAFLAKFTPDGAIVWATYFGGSNDDIGSGVCCDVSGNVYIVGGTESDSNIATLGAQQFAYGGGADAFIAKFNSIGTLLWATYYGGDGGDGAGPAVCDSIGNLYIQGSTTSSAGIATSGAYQTAYSGNDDIFVAKFSPSGILKWCTYLGGSNNDEVAGSMAYDGHQSIFVAGQTSSSSGFGTSGAWQHTLEGSTDAYLVKLHTDGSMAWSTYYGGESMENAGGVAVNSVGEVFLCGTTQSFAGIASLGTHQPSYAGGNDAFVAKFDSIGIRQWGTYYGGDTLDDALGITCDASSNVFISGATRSHTGISTPGAYQDTLIGIENAYLAEFNGMGYLSWATYYGTGNYGDGIAADALGNIYASGTSSQPGIGTTGTYQDTVTGSSDAFIIKFGSFSVGVSNVISPIKNMSVYPNPNNGDFTLNTQLESNYNSVNITITDEKGNIIYNSSETIPTRTLDKKISLGNITSGIYILHLSAGSFVMSTRFPVIK